MFNKITKTFQYGQHTVTLETGEIARQASGAVVVSVEDTVILATVVARKEAKPGQDFFPLTCKTCVDYTNTLADITVGYMGGTGEQWLIVRNARGAELLALLGDEVVLFERCHARGLAVMLKGPTGCGKTRFIEHMAWRLGRPLVTIACHDDLSASDLIGRFLIRHDGTAWQDGPLTRAVREGAICYLDEVVEARQDTVVVLHALTDHRRLLPIDLER